MKNRRHFLKNSGALAFGGLLMPELIAQSSLKEFKPMNKLGVGLFTLPKLLEKDFAGTLKMVSQIGYKEVEFFGPYTFSTKEDIEGWKGAAAALGFSGSGFFGHRVSEVKKILSDNGLSAPSMHASLGTLKQKMEELAEAANILGTTYVVLPSAPSPADLDGYKRQAEEFNEIGASAAKQGLHFAYHNHGNGLKEMNGKIPMEVILERTDPKLVYFQMDLFWTTAGGIDPVTFLQKYARRYRLLHIKDMSKAVRFSGDGSNPAEVFELFPYLTDAGSGVLDLKAILSQAQQTGVEHYLVERDLAPNAKEALQIAYRYLDGLKNDSKK